MPLLISRPGETSIEKIKNKEIVQICYSNWFDLEVIGSRQVQNLVKLHAFDSVSHIEYKKVYLKKMGRLAIVLKIRSKLTAFFLAIMEDSDIPSTGTEIRDMDRECFKDFNLVKEKQYRSQLSKLPTKGQKKKISYTRFF